MARQTLVDHCLLTLETSKSYSDTPLSIGLLWSSNQQKPLAENTQHLTTDIHAIGGDSNSQSQQASDRRSTP